MLVAVEDMKVTQRSRYLPPPPPMRLYVMGNRSQSGVLPCSLNVGNIAALLDPSVPILGTKTIRDNGGTKPRPMSKHSCANLRAAIDRVYVDNKQSRVSYMSGSPSKKLLIA